MSASSQGVRERRGEGVKGKDAGSGGEEEEEREGERCSWEKKISLVNLITPVTVCPGQTQQPNTLHLKQQSKHTYKNLPSLFTERRVRPQKHIYYFDFGI